MDILGKRAAAWALVVVSCFILIAALADDLKTGIMVALGSILMNVGFFFFRKDAEKSDDMPVEED